MLHAHACHKYSRGIVHARLPWGMVAIAAALAMLGSCGVTFYTDLTAPTGVTATQNLTDTIEVNWSEVRGSDVYYVYRLLSPDEQPETGPYGPLPYRTVTQTTLIDTEVDPTTYYYRVSAGRFSTGEESPPSEAAAGSIVPEEIGWDDAASSVFGGQTTVRLAIDRTGAEVAAYLLTVGDGSDSSAVVRRIESDDSFTNLGGPEESTDGSDPRVADVAAAGTLYVALVRQDDNSVTLFGYDADLEEWALVADVADIPGALPANAAKPFVTLLALETDELLLSYANTAGEISTYYYNGTLSEKTAPTVANALGQLDGAAVAGEAVLVYEDQDGLDTDAAYAATWDADSSDWSPATSIYDGSGAAANLSGNGSLSAAIDPVSRTVVVAYSQGGVITLTDESAALVAASSDAGFTGTPDPSEQAIAVAAYDDVVSLFYVDGVAESGVVIQLDTTAGEWAVFSPDDFTQSPAPSILSLAVGGGKLFAAYEDGGITRMRAYQ